MPFARRDGVRIWWDSSGEGRATILINGLSSPSDTWFRLARHLSPRYRVLTLDNRGVGRTGVPPGPYTVAMMAADVVAVLDAAGVTKAHIVGISMGGLIAQEIVLDFPKRVRSLVLVSTHAGIPTIADDTNPEVAIALAKGATLPPEERMEMLVPFLYHASTPRAEIDIDHRVRASLATDESGYLNQLRGVAAWERLAELPRIDVPTLVMHGAQDMLVPSTCAQLLAKTIPRAKLAYLESCGHEVFTDREHEAAGTVLNFLDSLNGGALS